MPTKEENTAPVLNRSGFIPAGEIIKFIDEKCAGLTELQKEKLLNLALSKNEPSCPKEVTETGPMTSEELQRVIISSAKITPGPNDTPADVLAEHKKYEKKIDDANAVAPERIKDCSGCCKQVKNKDGKMKYKYRNDNTECFMNWYCNECYPNY